eukprot:4047123-Amphidinium_carterae.1
MGLAVEKSQRATLETQMSIGEATPLPCHAMSRKTTKLGNKSCYNIENMEITIIVCVHCVRKSYMSNI